MGMSAECDRRWMALGVTRIAGAGAGGSHAALAGADERASSTRPRASGRCTTCWSSCRISSSGRRPSIRATSARARSMARSRRNTASATSPSRTFPTGQTWQPVVGELWMTTPTSREALRHPRHSRVARPRPTPTATSPANWSTSARARAQDFEGKDVKGKFVLSLAPSGLGGVYARAVAARRDRRARHQRDRRWRSRRRLSGSDRLDHASTPQPDTRGLGALAEEGARSSSACSNRGQKVTIRSIIKSEQVPGQAGDRARRDSRRRQHDAGSRDRRPPVRGLHQAGRQRRQLRLRADARSRPRLHQADRRREAAAGRSARSTSSGCRRSAAPTPGSTRIPTKQKAIIGDLNFDMEGDPPDA